MSLHQEKFIDQVKAVLLTHLSNEQFGVSELAEEMHMSRSNLLRKIKKNTELSASQFIRQIRLEEANKLLEETALSISEIAFKVGFGTNSYFIKCYKDEYGHPPGEARRQSFSSEVTSTPETEIVQNASSGKRKKSKAVQLIFILGLLLAVFFLFRSFYITDEEIHTPAPIKSIAVLPFHNLSSDTSNLYFVDGLMEAALTNLQKIEDLRVISRTSVEKYRNTQQSSKEIAEELHVNYLVEGSGQRTEDEVLLHIKLIDAATESPVWAEQFKSPIGGV